MIKIRWKEAEGVAFGSSFCLALANIMAGYDDEKLLFQMQKLPTYFKYVDDTFAYFNHEAEADDLLMKLNWFHTSFKFAFDKEKGKCPLLFDVYVERQILALKPVYTRNPLPPTSI